MYRFLLFIATFGFMSISSTSAQVHFESTAYFSQVELRGPIKAEFIPSDESRVVMTVFGTDRYYEEPKIRNGRLSVNLEVGVLARDKDVYASLKIYYNQLSYIGIQGATITNSEPMECQNIKIETLGGINRINLAMAATGLDIVATGDCQATFIGRAGTLNTYAYMGAKIDCGECDADVVVAVAKQRSEIVVRTSGVLNAKATLRSNIFYIGTPILTATARFGGGILLVPDSNIY